MTPDVEAAREGQTSEGRKGSDYLTWSAYFRANVRAPQDLIRRALVSGLMGLCRLLDPTTVFSPDLSRELDRLQHRVDELEGRA